MTEPTPVPQTAPAPERAAREVHVEQPSAAPVATEEPNLAEQPVAAPLVGALEPAPLAGPESVPPLPAAPVVGSGPVPHALPAIPPTAPPGVVAQVVAAAISGVTHVVRPEAAVAVAGEFTFPIALTLAVVAFLAVQGHIDRRDPKLRLAPQHQIETVIRFEPESAL